MALLRYKVSGSAEMTDMSLVRAVKTQVWCAIATYVLISIVKKELPLDASLYTCLQIFSVSVFEKTKLSSPLALNEPQTDRPHCANQLIFQDF